MLDVTRLTTSCVSVELWAAVTDVSLIGLEPRDAFTPLITALTLPEDSLAGLLKPKVTDAETDPLLLAELVNASTFGAGVVTVVMIGEFCADIVVM
ncbi:unnamed protein product [Hydatigera taeniaeformis]|uniref:Secreted protein n=1 Tax=Hydatigena taeniaeformis TaxID=6205 RepID=A0A0R3WKK6_HYDTA|nr:unnamed protein product [Hydatigera taeniaeformis]